MPHPVDPSDRADPIAALNAALTDRYVIDRELGEGGMATVYLARDLRHERFVALKALRPDVGLAVGRERFLREIRLAARLQHPNILAVYDSGEAAGVLYYVMPFVEGESLRDRLNRQVQLPLEEALQIAREVADALSYAHEHDVVHRDIKPENIMLTGGGGGHALVADFGIARAMSAGGADKLTKTGLAIGTAAYMSPEQATGTGQADHRSDIYSLACVLYEMLAGQPPFTGPTAHAIMARHSLETVPRLKIVREMIPDQLERVIDRALAKVPADRYQTAARFAEAVAAASTGRISRVSAARPFGSGGFPWRMRRPVVVATMLPVVAVFVVAAWFALGGSREQPARTGELEPRRVAVLYFQDLSRDSSLGYLAAGLTHGLIEELSRVQGIEVLSRNAVAPFHRDPPARDSIARALTAGSLVAGTVEPAGEQIRVDVRLVDGTSGVDLQRTSVALPARELLVVRDSVVQEVAELLRRSLGREVELRLRRAGTEHTDAWTLAQRGDWLRSEALRSYRGSERRNAGTLAQQADSLLAIAAARDPAWPVPLEIRARLAYERSRFEPGPLEAERYLQTGLRLVERALAIAPRSADALELRGTITFRRLELGLEPDRRGAAVLLAAAERDLLAATQINPGQVGAWTILSVLYYQKQDNIQANWAARRAYESDAFLTAAASVLWRLYATSYDLEQFESAADWCAKGRQRFPESAQFTECQLWLMTTSAETPDPARAWALAQEAVRRRPEPQREFRRRLAQIIVAAVLQRAGLADSARRVLQRARAEPDVDPRRELVGYEAWVRAQLGDHDEALRLLQEYLVANPRHREGFQKRVHWWWRPLQNHPRFKALVAGS